MNAAHLHLLVNHVPVLGVPFFALLLAYGLVRRQDDVQRAAFGALLAVALLTIATFTTGEPAEKVLRAMPGGEPRDFVHAHEEAADKAFVAVLVLGAGALAALIAFRRKPVPRWCAVTLLLAALAVSGVLAWTANLGGLIRHDEIRSEAGGPAG